MSARKIGLLLLILVMGGGVDAAWFLRQNVGVGASGCRVMHGRFYGPSYTFDSEEGRPLAPGAAVEVENSFGAVRVVQGPAAELKVALRKVVYRQTEDLARAFADRIHLRVDAGPTARVGTNREELDRGDPDVGFETHLELTVPPGTPVVVRSEFGRVDVSDVATADVSGSNDTVRVEHVAGAAQVRGRHGDVYVSGVGGTLTLSARHSNVQVEDVQGACTLDVEHGDTSLQRVGAVSLQAAHAEVRLQDVRGDLEVHAQHTSVTAEDVGGRAVVETSLQAVELRRVKGEARIKVEHGNVTASEVDGALTVEGAHTDVDLARVGGPLDVRVVHGGVRASDVEKGGRISASGSDVVIDHFAGPLEVDAQRAGVELHPTAALTESVVARTTFGDIRLLVPDGSRMLLQAVTVNGELHVDVPGLSVTQHPGGPATGTLGGGTNPVRLTADHGDVHVSSAPATRSARAREGDDENDDRQEDERNPRD